jgi:hypothetical protein
MSTGSMGSGATQFVLDEMMILFLNRTWAERLGCRGRL